MKANIAILVIILLCISKLQAFSGQRNGISVYHRRSVDDNGSRFVGEKNDRSSDRLDLDPWFRHRNAVDGIARTKGMYGLPITFLMRNRSVGRGRPVGRDEGNQWIRSRFRPGRFHSFNNDDMIRPRGNNGGRDYVIAHSRLGGSYGVQGKPRRRGRGRRRDRRRFN